MRFMIVSLAWLAGCASTTTPSEVLERGARSDFRTVKSPADAATCIQRNASEIRWGAFGATSQASTRRGQDRDSLEVLYGGEGATVAIAVVRPAANGADITIVKNPDGFGWLRGEGTLEQQMVKGC